MYRRCCNINIPSLTIGAAFMLIAAAAHAYASRQLQMGATTDMTMAPAVATTGIVGGECTERDIGIWQSKESSSGVPEFVVQIYSTCVDGCAPSQIHVKCQWFASKVVVNPAVFRRVAFDDCLVNGGQPLQPGHILHFTYQNTFMYALSFKSAKFC